MAQKPSIPKGTRDFSVRESAERTYIFNTIKDVFTQFGYNQIETPAMENLSTLLGKYGEEGDKLLFRILNSGDAFANVDSTKPIVSQICEKGLRYDLTVPFARYVVQHQNDISFPFKRYQIQPVWRADRPQKGRYREFYQCDVDVIGTRSLLCELELVQIVDQVFSRLGVNAIVKINNRKVLSGLSYICGFPEKLVDITIAIDKLDKIGLEAVKDELLEKGLNQEAIDILTPILCLNGSNKEKISTMRSILSSSEIGLKGLDELDELFSFIEHSGIKINTEIDLSLARGLNYYTGAIFEVKSLDYQIGSICGGGRYDNLTGIFGLKDMSGVGISFGADRIYDVLKGLNLFPSDIYSTTTLLFANMGSEEIKYILPIANLLRSKGISVEIYPESLKLKKQFDYAERKLIPFISIIGETEVEANILNIKNLQSGEQRSFSLNSIEDILSFLRYEAD